MLVKYCAVHYCTATLEDRGEFRCSTYTKLYKNTCLKMLNTWQNGKLYYPQKKSSTDKTGKILKLNNVILNTIIG